MKMAYTGEVNSNEDDEFTNAFFEYNLITGEYKCYSETEFSKEDLCFNCYCCIPDIDEAEFEE